MAQALAIVPLIELAKALEGPCLLVGYHRTQTMKKAPCRGSGSVLRSVIIEAVLLYLMVNSVAFIKVGLNLYCTQIMPINVPFKFLSMNVVDLLETHRMICLLQNNKPLRGQWIHQCASSGSGTVILCYGKRFGKDFRYVLNLNLYRLLNNSVALGWSTIAMSKKGLKCLPLTSNMFSSASLGKWGLHTKALANVGSTTLDK